MGPQLQQSTQAESLYQELEQIDQALHRLKERLVISSQGKNTRDAILLKTAGALNKKYTKKTFFRGNGKFEMSGGRNLEYRLVLITEDARDFKNIPDLDVRATL